MIRIFAITAALFLLPAAAHAATPALKTTSIEFPQTSATFSGGDAAKAINANCLICHSAEMVLTQPALPKEEWAKEVAKMRKAYGAPVQDKDVPAIVDYLAALKPSN